MKSITAYKCLNGHLEEDLTRAIAYDLEFTAKKMTEARGSSLSFSGALWIAENFTLVKQIVEQNA